MESNDIKSELESFREQWRAEVQSKAPGSKPQPQQTVSGPSISQHKAQHRAQPKTQPPKPQKASEPTGRQQSVTAKKAAQHDSDDDEYVAHSFDEPAPATSTALPSQVEGSEAESDEPVSALEHFEQAVEREAAGNLGDSLRLYRKAYRVSLRPPWPRASAHIL
jgi:F-box protein 9